MLDTEAGGASERPAPAAVPVLSWCDASLSRILQWPAPLRAVASAGFTLASLALRLGLIDRLGDHMVYAAFYPAVLVSALLCGGWGGIVAVLSILVCTHVPLFGRQISVFAAPEDSIAVVVFAFNSGIILLLAGALRALFRAHGVLDDLARKNAEDLGAFV